MSATFKVGNNVPVNRNKVANTALAASEKPKLFIEQLLPVLNLIVKLCMSSEKKVLLNVKSVKFKMQKQIKYRVWQSVLTSCDKTIMQACWVLFSCNLLLVIIFTLRKIKTLKTRRAAFIIATQKSNYPRSFNFGHSLCLMSAIPAPNVSRVADNTELCFRTFST
jgi:hypothetical protein